MLAREHRIRLPGDFRRALRGRRAGRPTVVVHLALAASHPGSPPGSQRVPTTSPAVAGVSVGPPRIGLIVSRAVGGATTRNRVRRRLRHLLAARLDRLPPGSLLVLRALPAAANASSAVLGDDVDAALHRLLPVTAPGMSR